LSFLHGPGGVEDDDLTQHKTRIMYHGRKSNDLH
jgi:hypothetical protein